MSEESKPYSVSGWLIFFALVMVVTGAMSLFESFFLLSPGVRVDHHSIAGWVTGIFGAYYVVFGLGLFTRAGWIAGQILMFGYYSLGMEVILLLVGYNSIALIMTIITMVLWLYLRNSDRVKRTYLHPPGKSPPGSGLGS